MKQIIANHNKTLINTKNTKPITQLEESITHKAAAPSKDLVFRGKIHSRDRTECSVCGSILLKKNLPTHMRRKHSEAKEVVCPCSVVDAKEGIHMVAKYIRGQISPVHVMLKHEGCTQKVLCDSDQCNASQAAVIRGGYLAYNCKHVNIIEQLDKQCCQVSKLEDETLQVAVQENLMSEKSAKPLQKFVSEAKNEGIVVAASWNPKNGDMVFISVYASAPSATYVGRYIVSFSRKSSKFHCLCKASMQRCQPASVAQASVAQW